MGKEYQSHETRTSHLLTSDASAFSSVVSSNGASGSSGVGLGMGMEMVTNTATASAGLGALGAPTTTTAEQFVSSYGGDINVAFKELCRQEEAAATDLAKEWRKVR